MPRFTNSVTGVVVNVDEATAAQLGPDWDQAGGGAESDDKPRRSRARKSD